MKVLPKWVGEFFDRHGVVRVRFRRKGYKTYYFKNAFPTKEFYAEYEACKAGVNAEPLSPGADRIIPASIGALYARYIANPSRLGPSPGTQKSVLGILGPFREKHGHRIVADFTFEHLDKILDAKAKEAPWQAEKLRKHLRRLFDFARKLRWIKDNPVDDTTPINAQKRTNSKGHHSWTEAEIRQFVARHPLGSKAYLALMLLLWSAQRRGDVSMLGPVPGHPGIMHIAQEKSGGQRELAIPIGFPLQEAIDAFPYPENWDGKTYLTTVNGRRYAKESFGNWFRERCDEAGLTHCSAHGLRKAASRRAAEANLSNQSIKSVTGHIRDDEVAYYTRAVEQAKLADGAVRKLEQIEMANRRNALDTQIDNALE